VRNVWYLRGELVNWRRGRKVKVHELRCLRCKRPLTKPCKPATRAHVFEVPEGFPHAGERFYARQTKPGKPADVRREPF
jgi:hypothetical protein